MSLPHQTAARKQSVRMYGIDKRQERKKKTCLQELGESQHLNNSEIDVVMQMSDIMFEQKVTHSHNLKLLLLMKH